MCLCFLHDRPRGPPGSLQYARPTSVVCSPMPLGTNAELLSDRVWRRDWGGGLMMPGEAKGANPHRLGSMHCWACSRGDSDDVLAFLQRVHRLALGVLCCRRCRVGVACASLPTLVAVLVALRVLRKAGCGSEPRLSVALHRARRLLARRRTGSPSCWCMRLTGGRPPPHRQPSDQTGFADRLRLPRLLRPPPRRPPSAVCAGAWPQYGPEGRRLHRRIR